MAKAVDQIDWKKLRARIESQDKKILISLIKDLFELSTGNRDFLGARYTDGGLKQYKRMVSEAIYPDFMNNRHARIDFSRARKALSDFKRACSDAEQILDLMLHYVEIGTRQANDISIDYESYYASLESMFSSVVKILNGKEKKYLAHFLPRLRKIVKTATDAYGYRDTLEEQLEDLTGEINEHDANCK